MSSQIPRLQDAPVVPPVPKTALAAGTNAPGSLIEALHADPRAFAYILLNVGDGDTQLLILPADQTGQRHLVIVDMATTVKLPRLLSALHDAGLIEEPGTPGQVHLLVATHPHHDHIGGMSDLLDRYTRDGFIDQFWEPGYFYPSPSFHNLMRRLEGRRDIR